MSAPSIAAPVNLQTIPWKDLKLGKLLGEGAYGEVYLGSWNGREVAIKKLILKKLPASLAKDFEREAKLMAECGQSPHILKLFGICTEEGQYSMVMEYMTKGSLNDVLSDEDIDLPWNPLRFRMAIDIGKGLAYLHNEREILHRDLKSHNVLLDQNFNAKITDFGLSKLKIQSTSATSKREGAKKSAGTLRWQAPELLELDPVHTKATDAYAYAMVLWEIASRRIPYGDADDAVIKDEVKKGKRAQIPQDCAPEYGKLIQQAWDKNPEKRPGAHYIVRQLEKFLSPAAKPLKEKSAPQPSPATPQITPAASTSEPTTETLQNLIIQLLDHPEIKNYPLLTPFLNGQMEKLFGLPEQPLNTSSLKIYKIIQKMITADKKISPYVAGLLEKALSGPQGNPPVPSSVSPAAPTKITSSPAPVLSPVKAPFLSVIPAVSFGKAQCEKYFGDVGIEPPLPPDIEQILDASCPFWPGKKVKETHLLTLIPQTVNGQSLTLKN